MRKAAALILGFMLLIGSLPVFAESSLSDRELFDLTSLGILTGDEAGNLNLDAAVSRAEFSAMIVRLLKAEAASNLVDQNNFSDIASDDWFARDVNTLYYLGLISGNPDGTFAPNDPVTAEQAIKVLVTALGYDQNAKAAGGYPNGYFAVASSIGLLKGADLSGQFTRGTLGKLIYNALDIDMMTTADNGSYEVKKGTCLRNLHIYEDANGSVVKEKGIVTATAETWLSRPIANMKQDEVEIGGFVYRVGETKVQAYLGQEVEFYAVEDEAGNFVLRSVQPTQKNEVLTLEKEDVTSASLKEIRYFESDEAQRETSYGLDTPAVVINGVLDSGASDDSLSIADGSYTIIDNDGDGMGDVVFVEAIETVRVKSVGQQTALFDSGQTAGGEGKIYYDPLDKTKHYTIKNRNGELMEFSEIEENDILSVAVSADKTVYHISASDLTVEGTISEISGDELTVEGETYKRVPGMGIDIAVGDTVTLYLDYRGKVAAADKAETIASYGYIIKSATESGAGASLFVKMLQPGEITEDVEIDESNEDNKVSIPTIKIKNNAVKKLEVADRFSLNGTKQNLSDYTSGTKSLVGVVKYKTNSEGKISRIETPDRDGMGNKRQYNAYEKIFCDPQESAFAVDSTTKVLCIPDENSSISGDVDYLTTGELNNGQTYSIVGYDLDDRSQTAAVVVAKIPMNYYAGGVINNASKVAVASRVTQFVDENGDERRMAYFMSEGKEMNYPITDNAETPEKQSAVNSLKSGDVFFYSLNNADEIDNVQLLLNVAGKTPYQMVETDQNTKLFGLVDTIRYNDISIVSGRRVHTVTLEVSASGALHDTEINVRNMVPVYRFRRNTQEVSVMKAEEIQPYRHELFLYLDGKTVKAIVVAE